MATIMIGTRIRQAIGKSAPIGSKADRKTRRISPQAALALAKRIRTQPELLQRQHSRVRGFAGRFGRDPLERRLAKLSPRQARGLAEQVDRKMHDLDQRKVLEAEARTYRPKAQQQRRPAAPRHQGGAGSQGRGSDAMFARLERGQRILQGGARSLAVGAMRTGSRLVHDLDRQLQRDLMRPPPQYRGRER